MKLSEIRKGKGITQKKLAEDTGLTQAYISELENGKKNDPTLSVMQGIADALGVSVTTVVRAITEQKRKGDGNGNSN